MPKESIEIPVAATCRECGCDGQGRLRGGMRADPLPFVAVMLSQKVDLVSKVLEKLVDAVSEVRSASVGGGESSNKLFTMNAHLPKKFEAATRCLEDWTIDRLTTS